MKALQGEYRIVDLCEAFGVSRHVLISFPLPDGDGIHDGLDRHQAEPHAEHPPGELPA